MEWDTAGYKQISSSMEWKYSGILKKNILKLGRWDTAG
jgi:hypothetical protein